MRGSPYTTDSRALSFDQTQHAAAAYHSHFACSALQPAGDLQHAGAAGAGAACLGRIRMFGMWVFGIVPERSYR